MLYQRILRRTSVHLRYKQQLGYATATLLQLRDLLDAYSEPS